MLIKLFKKILKHKFIGLTALLLITVGGYFVYRSLIGEKDAVRYLTEAVEKGTLIVSISGSGQVSASNQLDINSKKASEVEAVYIQKGEEVKTGKLIIKLDDADFQKAITNAETSLETAQLELEELLAPPDELTLLKAENAVSAAEDSLEKLKLTQETERQKILEAGQKAEDDIEKAYEDALTSITAAFWDLPAIVTELKNVLHSNEIAENHWGGTGPYQSNESIYINSFNSEDQGELRSFLDTAEDDYKTAEERYEENLKNYRETGHYSEKETIEDLLNQTIETIKSISQAIKSEVNLLDFVVDYLSDQSLPVFKKITDYQTDLKSHSSKTNTHLLNLLSIQDSLQDAREDKLSAERDLAEIEKTHPLDLTAAQITLKEKEKSLEELKAGPDKLEIRAKEITVEQRKDALLEAKQDLADCYVYAPFGGIIADVKIKKGDSVSSGTILASIITQQKIAEISLNEVDVANVKVGQKATLTFDALSEVSIAGKVLEVDAVGEITQGVVSYGVKIAFNTDDERIKPGMSVTADIITDIKQDILVLSNNAIKSQGDFYYVELVEVDNNELRQQLLANVSGTILSAPLKQQQVEVGISNDISTEIISGLKEDDIVVASTINSAEVRNNQTQGTQFRMPGMDGQQIRVMR